MKTLATWVIQHRKTVFILFGVLFLICLGARSLVQVNYDLTSYLPEESQSTKALNVLTEEFGQGIPKARVMVSDVTIGEAIEYKKKISKVNGVTDVTWLDDAVDTRIPLETMDKSTVETYYKENNALFFVTIDSSKRLEAVDGIRSLVGNKGALTGSDVSTAIGTESTVKEVMLITIVGILFALLILVFTTSSWIEPLIILAGLVVAVVINMGTNLVFGSISFVTNAAGSILQMAVSLDYSVFLLHRYEEKLQSEAVPQKAMFKAINGAASSILASGLTTIIGFLALTLMRFKIGPDLGIALAKGVIISLICVFTIMPSLVLSLDGLINKTRHKKLLPSFDKFSGFVGKVTVPLVIAFVLVVAPAYLASNSSDFNFGSSKIFGSETEYGQDTQKIDDTFGTIDTFVLMVPKGNLARETELSTELKSVKGVSSIVSYVDKVGDEVPTEFIDSKTLEKLMSDNYSRMVISLDAKDDTQEGFSIVKKIRNIGEKYYGDKALLAGTIVSTYDMKDTVTADLIKINIVAIAAVFLVLLFMMKSVTLPVILVAAIETAIWINMSIPYFSGDSVFYIAYLLISTIQLGATVDYAILMTDRYLEFRKDYVKKQAMKRTISVVSVSILTSGSVMTVMGFLMGKLCSHQVISQLGYFLGRGTICSLIIVLFVLPGMLYLLDGVIKRTTRIIDFKKMKKGGLPNEKIQ